MTRIIADRVMETSTTTGTGAVTLAGAVMGYRTLASVCSVGDTVDYTIIAVDSSGVPTGDWETGRGTYSGTNTLTRTTVQASSNSGSAVSFGAGTKRVMISHNTASLRPPAWGFNPPLASSFSLMSSDATNLALTDDADVGLLVDINGLVSSAVRYAYRTLTTPSSAWDMVIKMPRYFGSNNYAAGGVHCFNSSNNRHNSVGSNSDTSLFVNRYSDKTALSSTLYLAGIGASLPGVQWFRTAFDGTNIKYYVSAEGKQWSLLYTEAPSTYLTASGGSVDRVGFYLSIFRTTGDNPVASVPYFSLTGPGV